MCAMEWWLCASPGHCLLLSIQKASINDSAPSKDTEAPNSPRERYSKKLAGCSLTRNTEPLPPVMVNCFDAWISFLTPRINLCFVNSYHTQFPAWRNSTRPPHWAQSPWTRFGYCFLLKVFDRCLCRQAWTPAFLQWHIYQQSYPEVSSSHTSIIFRFKRFGGNYAKHYSFI